MKKRSKKQNETASEQLCLFELPKIRQEEERRMKPKKKPVAPSKPAALTFIPPAPVQALKQPENTLKTEMSDRQELDRAWKANPEALDTLNQMVKKNPAVLTLVRRLGLVPLCIALLFSCGRSPFSENSPEEENPTTPTLEQAISFLALAEGWHDSAKTGCTG